MNGEMVERFLSEDEWYPFYELEPVEAWMREDAPSGIVMIPAELAERHDRVMRELRALHKELAALFSTLPDR